MKRTPREARRLTLARETLAELEPTRLVRLAGGSLTCVSGCMECPPDWTWVC